MKPIERVMKTLQSAPVDRKPNLCIIMTFASTYCGVPYSKYVSDYKTLVDCSLKVCEDFGIDLLCAISDPMREAAGFGVDVAVQGNEVPYARNILLKELSDVAKLSVHKPEECERMFDRVMAVQYFKEKAGEDYPICGWVEGPVAEACDLRNINNFMMDFYEEDDAVTQLLEICTEQAILFAQSQVREGAQMIGVGDAAASLIGPALYKQFAFPYEKRLIDAIHGMGAKVKLHICGNINPLLEDIAQLGADIVDCDWMVDFKKAVELFGSKTAACGNFDPVQILLEGDVSVVDKAVRDCIAVSNPNTLIAAGCEVPTYTPHDNLRQVTKTLSSLAQ